MTKAVWRDEPAREALYRTLKRRIDGQDSCITYLLVEMRALQKRVEKLEKRDDGLTSAALRQLAHDNVETARRMEQCNGLSLQDPGDQTDRHPPATTGL